MKEKIIPLTEQEKDQDKFVVSDKIFCLCGGKVQSDFVVGCETGEENCPLGGWIHP